MIVRTTEDGSKTVYSEQFKQYYHSVFGAKTESEWVYIDLGYLDAIKKFEEIRILEVGFGTGLNAFLSQ
jgi:tRNA U34 5-methylaminomethyl-2-thiouridine-forming methyltransferase MnmC